MPKNHPRVITLTFPLGPGVKPPGLLASALGLAGPKQPEMSKRALKDRDGATSFGVVVSDVICCR